MEVIGSFRIRVVNFQMGRLIDNLFFEDRFEHDRSRSGSFETL